VGPSASDTVTPSAEFAAQFAFLSCCVAMQIYGELFKDGTGQASASKAALAFHQVVVSCALIMFPSLAGYHLFTLVYSVSLMSFHAYFELGVLTEQYVTSEP